MKARITRYSFSAIGIAGVLYALAAPRYVGG